CRYKLERSASDSRAQSLSLDAFHSDVNLIVGLTKLVYRGNIWMTERRCHLSFALQSRPGFLVLDEIGRKKLEGDCTLKLKVFGFPDLSLPAGTQALEHA